MRRAMNPAIKNRLFDLGFAVVAVTAGAVIIHFGDKFLGVTLEYYRGVDTFTPLWVVDLFGVPFIAGIAVSLIYGLGGKILAHLSPLVVRITSFYELHHGLTPPEHVTVLPLSFWVMIVVVSAEFAAIGGVVGEIIVKRTYGRTGNKALLHKKFQRKTSGIRVDNQSQVIQPPKGSVEGVD